MPIQITNNNVFGITNPPNGGINNYDISKAAVNWATFTDLSSIVHTETTEIADISQNLSDLSSIVHTETTEIADISQNLSDLSSVVDIIIQDVSDISQNLSDLSGVVDSIIQDVIDISQNLSDLSGVVDSVIQDVIDISQNLSDLSGVVDSVIQDVSDISQNLSDLSGVVDSVIQDVSDISQNLSDLSSVVDDVSQNLSELSNDVLDISQILNANIFYTYKTPNYLLPLYNFTQTTMTPLFNYQVKRDISFTTINLVVSSNDFTTDISSTLNNNPSSFLPLYILGIEDVSNNITRVEFITNFDNPIWQQNVVKLSRTLLPNNSINFKKGLYYNVYVIPVFSFAQNQIPQIDAIIYVNFE